MSNSRFKMFEQTVVYSIGLTLLLFISAGLPNEKQYVFQYLTRENVLLDIYEHYDQNGKWVGFTTYIDTPVCEDKLCLNTEIIFYWDLMGNFKSFELIPEKPLTKQDHKEFTKADYDKLTEILLLKSPSFVHMRRGEMVETKEGLMYEVDGISAETLITVKEDMVAGALYTCFTLWHIANGPIPSKIEEYTKGKLDEALVNRFLNSHNKEEHIFLLNNIPPEQVRIFLPEILKLSKIYGSYHIGQIVDKVPDDLIGGFAVQQFIRDNYANLTYNDRLKLLRKLQDVKVNQTTLEMLIGELKKENTNQNENIIKLVYKNTNSDNIKVIKKMMDIIKKDNIVVSEELYQQLLSLKRNH